MKKLIAAILLIAATIIAAGPTPPPSVTVAWDVSPTTAVDSYAIYWGVGTRNYTNSVVVIGRTNTSCVIGNLARGVTYYFAATAKVGILESDYSNEAVYSTTPLPLPPSNTRVSILTP